MRIFIIIVLTLAHLGHLSRWDMETSAWRQAEELCAPFGGVTFADRGVFWARIGGFDHTVTALCTNGQKVHRAYREDAK